MKLFIEDDSFLTEENKNFINNIVLDNNFPYYIQKGSLKSDNKYILYHTYPFLIRLLLILFDIAESNK